MLEFNNRILGNTMGYVRMIKAGGLHFLSNSIRFVPDLDDIPNFEQLVIDEGLDASQEAIEAAKIVDSVVDHLGTNFSDNTEYFEVSLDLSIISFIKKYVIFCVCCSF